MAEETDTSVKTSTGPVGTDLLKEAETEVEEKFSVIDQTEDMLESSKDLAKIRVLDDKVYWFEEQLRQDQALLTKLQRGGPLNFYNKGELMDLPLSVENTLQKVLESMEFALGRDIEQVGEAFNPNNILSALQEMVSQFSEKMMPLLTIPNIPEVPIIGDVNDIMDQMVAMSQLASKIPPEELSAHQKNRDHKWYEIPPEIKTQINDIKEDVQSVVQQLPMLLINFLVSAVDTLWKLVKKIMDVLGLSDAAFPLNLIDSAKELANSIWQLMKDFKVMIERIVRGIIQKIIAVYDYAFGPSLDDQYLMDQLSSEISQLKVCLEPETIIEPKPACSEEERITIKGYPERIKDMREQYVEHLMNERQKAREESIQAMKDSWLGRNTIGAVQGGVESVSESIKFAKGLPEVAEKVATGDTEGAIEGAIKLNINTKGLSISDKAAIAVRNSIGGAVSGGLDSGASSLASSTSQVNASSVANYAQQHKINVKLPF